MTDAPASRLPGQFVIAAVALVLGLSSCDRSDEPAGKRYPLQGVVVAAASAQGQIMVKHEAIDGVMPAMTMPFAIRGSTVTAELDDHLSATLVITETDSWLENVTLIRSSRSAASPEAQAMTSRAVGQVVPNFRLQNHESEPIDFDNLRGRVVILTFIYTRCPLPDYCPRMMRHLDAIKRTLEREPEIQARVHFVGVSFDPEYDTPARLKAYGETFLTGPDRFKGVDLATGAPTEVQALAGFFGVKYVEEAGQISHSLATAVIGANGRVAAVFPSNTWTPDEVLEVVRNER